MVAFPGPFEPGYRLMDGDALNRRTMSTQSVAAGTGGPPGPPVLSAQITEATGTGNSVVLPVAQLGAAFTVVNNTAAALNVFASNTPNPATGVADQVQLAQDSTLSAFVPVAHFFIATFICYRPGTWKTFYPGATQP